MFIYSVVVNPHFYAEIIGEFMILCDHLPLKYDDFKPTAINLDHFH